LFGIDAVSIKGAKICMIVAMTGNLMAIGNHTADECSPVRVPQITPVVTINKEGNLGVLGYEVFPEVLGVDPRTIIKSDSIGARNGARRKSCGGGLVGGR
jgi:hypothetical protein